MDYSVPSVKWKTKLILNFCTLLILLNSLINANYVKDPNICGNPKCKVGTKFNYQPKTTYKYKYNIAISTRFDGASSNSSDLFIGALITLTFRSHCEGILQVKNAQISHNIDTHYSTLGSKSQQFDVNLSKYLLRFYFEDGEIAQICPHVNESIWALNIKKGILSNFQNTMQRFDVDQHAYERDINGDCMVRYSYEDVNGTTLSLTKRTELSTCYNRHQLYSIIPVTPYVFQKKYHKWSPINSSLTCSQSIDHKVYKSIICEEKHDYRAFYEQTDGATTRSNSKLILVIERNSSNYEIEQFTSLGKIRKRDNLLFDHRRPIRATHDNLHECKKSILLLCQLSNTVEFQPMYPDVFNKLIHTGRDLTVQAMTKLYKESAEICPTARKHLKDALPYIRNRASTKVMADIILSGEISEERVQDWLLIMAFFPRPDGETMDSVNRIIMKQNNDSQTMLSISTMINSYCKNHEDCQENHSVQTIIEKFESLFNESCKNGLDDDMAYTALKCIGNAGVLTETLLSSVNYCIKNENLPNEIRLAAIQSLRRLPCGSNDNLLISIFKNNSINEELRISSYQHIIRCPSYSILNIIRDVLENEDCNQVGSYVWSHLKTQMSSAYPSRVDIQAMLQDSHLNNKFNKDFRIFSKNYEYSFYLNNYGIGVFYEMNVIFSYKSYIPRNIVSNVTVLIFGEVVNIMEVNVYIEGLEQYVEKIFAESGTFNKDSISHILQIVRVVRNQPNPLKYLIQNLPFKKIFDHLRVSISLKIFGNELKFYRIRGHSDFVNILDNLDPITIIKRFLDGKEMTYESSTMLIDTSYVTPMSSGLPLKLNAIATTAININTMCFVNATVWSTNNALEMNGKLYPSVGLNFEGTLEVDAFFTETGIRFKGLMYTSTAIEGSFEMDTFKLMRLTFNLPLQKSNIFHVETELSLVTDEKFTNLEDLAIGRHKKELCTWKILEEVVGLKLCATSLFPDAVHILQSPILLFTGPINLALVLEKTDPTATKYIVQYETTTDMNKTSVMFEFRTPGSLTKRGMTANIELDTQSQNISLTYTSTRSQLVAEGYYRNSPLEKHVNFALDIDGKKHVDFQIGLDITPAKYGNTYYPKFLLAINDKRIVSLSGSIKWVAKKGISQCDIDIDFQTNRFETIIIGYVRISEASFATRVNLDYRFGGTGQLETVASELEIMDKSTKNLKYYIGQLQIESTAYPYINSITSLKFQKAQNHIDSHLKMVTLSKNDSNVLHVIWDYEQFKAFTMNKLNTSITVYKPNSDIDIKFGFIKQETTANFTTVIVVKYAQEKEIVTVLDINIPHASMFYYESRLRVTLHNAKSNEQMSIHTKIWEKLHNEYDLEFAGIWFSGHNVTLKGMYQDKSTLLVSTYALKFLIKSQLFNDILFNGKLINSDEEFKTEMQVEYNDVFYGIIFRHASEHTAIYHTFVQILYNTTIYSATNQIDFNEMKDILDLHFDQYRDVHIVIHGYTNSTRLDSGLEVKWDSNRDPSCKFIFLFQTNTLAKLRRDGRCILEYPGRVITSTFQILHIGVDYIMSVTAEWSPIDVITGDFHAIVDLKKSRELKFTGKSKDTI